DRLEEGVVLLDRTGRVRAANASARALLPLRAEWAGTDPAGRLFRDAVRHQGLGRWVAEALPSSSGGAGGGVRDGVYQVERGDGPEDSPADLLCHLRVLHPGGGDGEVLLTLVDVISFRNLDRAKTDFVANAS